MLGGFLRDSQYAQQIRPANHAGKQSDHLARVFLRRINQRRAGPVLFGGLFEFSGLACAESFAVPGELLSPLCPEPHQSPINGGDHRLPIRVRQAGGKLRPNGRTQNFAHRFGNLFRSRLIFQREKSLGALRPQGFPQFLFHGGNIQSAEAGIQIELKRQALGILANRILSLQKPFDGPGNQIDQIAHRSSRGSCKDPTQNLDLSIGTLQDPWRPGSAEPLVWFCGIRRVTNPKDAEPGKRVPAHQDRSRVTCCLNEVLRCIQDDMPRRPCVTDLGTAR